MKVIEKLATMPVEEVAAYFDTISRQRVGIFVNESKGTQLHAKLLDARKVLRLAKKARKPKKQPTADQLARKKCRMLWENMRKRCYDEEFHEKQPNYRGCSIAFKDFDDFSDWATQQPGFNVPGFQLDKDILVKGNRVYSRGTCCFVPKEVNFLLIRCTRHRSSTGKSEPVGVSFYKITGKYAANVNEGGKGRHLGYFGTQEEASEAYKAAKEEQIRTVAGKYKDQMDPKAYNALVAWSVEFTD